MYPKNAASPERIAIGPVVLIADGTVQTSGVSVKVLPFGTTASAGGGTIAYEEGIVHYTPTQAETNYTSFILIAYKASCIPASVTIVTTASAVAGYAAPDWAVIRAPTTTVNLSGTTISTSQAVASVSGAVGSVTARVTANTDQLAGQTVTAAAGVTFPTSIASPTNITAGTITTVTNLTNLPTIPANWLTAAGMDATASAEIADAVWDEAISGHLGAGSTGAALNAAGSAGDPWTTPLPGAYGAGTAGYIIGTNLDTTVGSRSTLDAAGVRTAVGLASANLDTQLGDLPTAVENADALLGRNVAGGSSTGRLVKEALYALRNRWGVSAGTYTVYATDDSTPAWTSSVTGTAGADPLTASDPA